MGNLLIYLMDGNAEQKDTELFDGELWKDVFEQLSG